MIDLVQPRTADDWDALGIVCPRCRGRLADGAGVLACRKCVVQYPVLAGIPDLRTGHDPYLTRDEDHAAAVRLLAAAPTHDFAALFATYYEGNAKVPPAQAAQFTRGALAAGGRADATLDVWLQQPVGTPAPPARTALDVGCGTAPLAIAMSRRGIATIGIDAGLRWLVLARRRGVEAGLDIPLVCANAETLPVRDGAVECVAGESVLENLADPTAALQEMRRVLGVDGRLWLTTPNRRSLGPDPHVGVLAGGWWPDAALRRRVERAGQVYPRRRLFSPGELRSALGRAGFSDVRLALPRIAQSQQEGLPSSLRVAIGGYHVASRLPLVSTLLLAVGPTIVCSARR